MKSGSVSASGTAFERRRKCLRLLAAQFLDEIVARCGVGKIELFSPRQKIQIVRVGKVRFC